VAQSRGVTSRARVVAAVVILSAVAIPAAPIVAQTPLDTASVSLRSHLALQALDRYLETWNSRDPKRWAASLHYPHIRPGPGAFELSNTPEQYAAGVDFAATLKTGWHHSEWTSRRVVQVGLDKVHVAGSWQRYTEDGRALVGSAITYVVTNDRGRWGVLSRFAAGPTSTDLQALAANEAAAVRAVADYFTAWNSHNAQTLAAAQHYPFVRIGDGAVEVSASIEEFLAGAEPGRQRTWSETRLDRVEAVQASTSGVNVAITYSRRERSGTAMSSYEAIVLVVRRDGAWKVQAISTMGV
jgi:hypothetical protein